jgi:hypothetical protein
MSKLSKSYTFTGIDVPGATFTSANGINGRGEVVGHYSDSSGTHGFIYDKGTFGTIDAPSATSTSANGINGRGEVVGHYSDSSGNHGFIYDKGTFTTIDGPDAASSLGTYPIAINGAGEVVGTYLNGSSQAHGFVARPKGHHPAAPAAVTVADLLTSRAGRVSMSDLLPASPATDAQSTHQEKWAAPLERPVGAQFVALAYRGDAATALQVLPSGNG